VSAFDDLLTANEKYADTFDLGGFDGIAHAGVALITCMDSRLDPLAMVGLSPGDAKILRNPGGRVTDQVLVALVLGAAALNVDRVMIIEHTRCAMAASDYEGLIDKISRANGSNAAWLSFGVINDQEQTLKGDALRVRAHPLIPDSVAVGGFLYDVDTGRLRLVVEE